LDGKTLSDGDAVAPSPGGGKPSFVKQRLVKQRFANHSFVKQSLANPPEAARYPPMAYRPVLSVRFFMFSKTTKAKPFLALIHCGFPRMRRSLAAIVNVSCPRLPAPVTA
jgi:hypothetical protein